MKISISNKTTGTNTKSDTANPVPLHTYEVNEYAGGYGQGAVRKVSVSALASHKVTAGVTSYIDPEGLDEAKHAGTYTWTEKKDDLRVGGQAGSGDGYNSGSHKVAFDIIETEPVTYTRATRDGIEAGYNGDDWSAIDGDPITHATDKLPIVATAPWRVFITSNTLAMLFKYEKKIINGTYHPGGEGGCEVKYAAHKDEAVVIKMAPSEAGKTITPGTGTSATKIGYTAVPSTYWSDISETIDGVTYTKKLTIPAGVLTANLTVGVTEV